MNEGPLKKIWVAGEALIDLVPLNGEVKAIVGGGPANTAKALAKLGFEVCFIGGISSDSYGAAIREELHTVDLSLALASDLPTALAEVSLDSSGSASYKFTLEGTATFNFHNLWLPNGSPDVLHIGTLATLVEPGASELYSWAKGLDSLIVFDPNVRSSVLSDAGKYREIFESWALISKIVKMSEEDLHFLGYSGGEKVLALGPELVVITKGADGMEGITSKGLVSVPGVKVEVVDTVGAGDTVGAILVEGLFRYGFDDLKGKNLFTVLTRAVRAAAITCSRAGASPPSAKELDL
ncbi:MAG: carbohydrate kinase [Actinobacteria bacterium]|nr:carbohydrate kinase [Actinomycetota bacterium]